MPVVITIPVDTTTTRNTTTQPTLITRTTGGGTTTTVFALTHGITTRVRWIIVVGEMRWNLGKLCCEMECDNDNNDHGAWETLITAEDCEMTEEQGRSLFNCWLSMVASRLVRSERTRPLRVIFRRM